MASFDGLEPEIFAHARVVEVEPVLEPPGTYESIGEIFTESALTLAALIRVQPRKYFRRYMDRMDITGSRPIHTISYELKLPSDLEVDQPLLIPLAAGRRNVLQDDSTVAVSSGSIRRLTSAEELAFCSYLIRSAFLRAMEGYLTAGAYTRDFYTHLGKLQAIPFSSPKAAEVATYQCVNWLRTLPFIPNEDRVDSLISTALFFGQFFIKAVEVRTTDREVVITRTTDDPPTQPEKTLRGRLRVIFGRKPYKLSFDLTDVTDAKSYHVFVSAPPGHHIHRTRVQEIADESGKQAQYAPMRAGLYRSNALGSDQAHLYFSSQDPEDAKYLSERGVRWSVDLAEDLPGSLLPALFAGGLTVALALITLAFAGNGLPTPSKPTITLAAAFPSFFLTIPGITSIAFRPQDNGAVVNGPLISALAPLVIALCSFVLAGTYLSEVLHPRSNHRVFFWISWPTAGVASFVFVYLLVRVIHKVWSEVPGCKPPIEKD